jgi:prefoldin subunit 5
MPTDETLELTNRKLDLLNDKLDRTNSSLDGLTQLLTEINQSIKSLIPSESGRPNQHFPDFVESIRRNDLRLSELDAE